MHSAFSDLSDVGADRPFAGVAFYKMRRPGTQRDAQHAGVESVSESFQAHREPQQSTRFGPSRDKSFSQFKDGTSLMRLPSAMGSACAATAATSFKPVGLATEAAPLGYAAASSSSPTANRANRRMTIFSPSSAILDATKSLIVLSGSLMKA